MNERQAIIDRIGGDAPTAAMLDTYGGEPAIFSPKKPADHDYKEAPTVLVRIPTAVDDLSTFRGKTAPETRGQRSAILVDVVVYGQFPMNSTDDSAIEEAAKAIKRLFRGKRFAAADGLTYQALVSGPIAAPSDSDQVAGYLLQLRLNCGG